MNDKQMVEMPEHLRPIEFGLFTEDRRDRAGIGRVDFEHLEPFHVDIGAQLIDRTFFTREPEGEDLQRPFEILIRRHRKRPVADDQFVDMRQIGYGDLLGHDDGYARRQRGMAQSMPLNLALVRRIAIVHEHLEQTKRKQS